MIYEFENRVIPTQKNEKTIQYTLLNNAGNQLLRINLNTKSKYWLITFMYKGKQRRPKTADDIKPNTYCDYQKRLYHFNKMIDTICTLYLKGELDLLFNDNDDKIIQLSTVINDFLEFKTSSNIKPNSIKFIRYQLSYLKTDFSGTTLNDFIKLSNRYWTVYLSNKAKTNKWTNSTYNNYLSIIKSLYTFILINKNDYKIKHFDIPTLNIFKRTVLKEDIISHKIYSKDDYKLISNELENDILLKLVFRIIWDTHLRPNEIRQLQLKELDLMKGTINLHPLKIKTNKGRVCKLSDLTITLFKDILKNYDTSNKDLYIFGLKGVYCSNVACSDEFFYQRFVRIRTKLNLDKNYSLYSMKHFANVVKYQMGVKLHHIQALNGHSTLQMTMQYLRQLGIMIDDDDKIEMIDISAIC